ncbi:baseplate J/gp47 family protein [bacterium]|nr:baseplate J/gp47 family protein [bacterium]
MASVTKNSTYHFEKLKAAVKARVPGLIFRAWDPLTAWLDATSKRAAEVSAAIAQVRNDFFIDSAQGDMLRRRLETNEGIPRLLARGADDGLVTLSRQTPPNAPITFPVGAIRVAPPPDPSKPSADRPFYTNAQPLIIAPGATSWTVPFIASRGGTDTNMPVGIALQIITQSTQLDGAVVAEAFTNGTDDESDSAYRLRAKLEIRSRTKGTDDSLIAAALTAGAVVAYTVEDFTTPGAAPVTLYCADGNGLLPPALLAEVRRHLNGDRNANPPISAARAKGIWVDVKPIEGVTFNFSIKLVLQPWVTGTLVSQLREDVLGAVTTYVRSLNDPGANDRVMRINRIKDICLSFQGRGVIDVDNASFLPVSNFALAERQMAIMGGLTWL